MDDDDKADLARKGMKAAELLEPGAIRDKLRGDISDAAGEAALRGIAALGRLTGKDRSPARSKAVAAVELGNAFRDWDAADSADFEKRVRAAADKARRDARASRMDLAALRRSFPEPSRELALLIFNCVDLLEDLSDDAEGQAPSADELAKKEALLVRFAELLAPNAGEALRSFVGHVVEISRQHREG